MSWKKFNFKSVSRSGHRILLVIWKCSACILSLAVAFESEWKHYSSSQSDKKMLAFDYEFSFKGVLNDSSNLIFWNKFVDKNEISLLKNFHLIAILWPPPLAWLSMRRQVKNVPINNTNRKLERPHVPQKITEFTFKIWAWSRKQITTILIQLLNSKHHTGYKK